MSRPKFWRSFPGGCGNSRQSEPKSRHRRNPARSHDESATACQAISYAREKIFRLPTARFGTSIAIMFCDLPNSAIVNMLKGRDPFANLQASEVVSRVVPHEKPHQERRSRHRVASRIARRSPLCAILPLDGWPIARARAKILRLYHATFCRPRATFVRALRSLAPLPRGELSRTQPKPSRLPHYPHPTHRLLVRSIREGKPVRNDGERGVPFLNSTAATDSIDGARRK